LRSDVGITDIDALDQFIFGQEILPDFHVYIYHRSGAIRVWWTELLIIC
jgi:hypothetical protein